MLAFFICKASRPARNRDLEILFTQGNPPTSVVGRLLGGNEFHHYRHSWRLSNGVEALFPNASTPDRGRGRNSCFVHHIDVERSTPIGQRELHFGDQPRRHSREFHSGSGTSPATE